MRVPAALARREEALEEVERAGDDAEDALEAAHLVGVRMLEPGLGSNPNPNPNPNPKPNPNPNPNPNPSPKPNRTSSLPGAPSRCACDHWSRASAAPHGCACVCERGSGSAWLGLG